MALTFENTCEGGTDGVDVSAANSGGASGTAWDVVDPGGTPDAQYDNAQAMHGSLSILWATDARNVRWYGLNSRTIYVRGYFRKDGTPSGLTQLFAIRTSGDGFRGGIWINTSNRVIATGSNYVPLSGTNISAHAISNDTWYRIEGIFEVDDTTAANGRIRYGIYVGDSTTPITTVYDSGAAAGLGTDIIDRLYIGPGGASGINLWGDTFGAQAGLTTFQGPWVAPGPWYVSDGTDLIPVNMYVSDGV